MHEPSKDFARYRKYSNAVAHTKLTHIPRTQGAKISCAESASYVMKFLYCSIETGIPSSCYHVLRVIVLFLVIRGSAREQRSNNIRMLLNSRYLIPKFYEV